MGRQPRIPTELLGRPFSQAEARGLGVTSDMLMGRSWKRLHPRVWVHRDHQMTHLDSIAAAAMAMPDHAQLSHGSRIQLLGLDVGEHVPIRFTVAGDLHIDTEDIFLHRTEVLPPLDAGGVTPASAFIQYLRVRDGARGHCGRRLVAATSAHDHRRSGRAGRS